jgi:hypothetical protein
MPSRIFLVDDDNSVRDSLYRVALASTTANNSTGRFKLTSPARGGNATGFRQRNPRAAVAANAMPNVAPAALSHN